MKLKDYIFIMASFIGCLLFFKFCGKATSDEDISHTDTIYVKTKDVWHELKSEIKAPVINESHYHEIIYKNEKVDTGAIIRDYFTKRTYSDTLRNDSIDIFVREEVFKNSLESRKIAYKWKAPERIIRQTIYKDGLLIGGYIGISQTPQLGISGILERKKWAFGAGYDILNKTPQIHLFRKITKK